MLGTPRDGRASREGDSLHVSTPFHSWSFHPGFRATLPKLGPPRAPPIATARARGWGSGENSHAPTLQLRGFLRAALGAFLPTPEQSAFLYRLQARTSCLMRSSRTYGGHPTMVQRPTFRNCTLCLVSRAADRTTRAQRFFSWPKDQRGDQMLSAQSGEPPRLVLRAKGPISARKSRR